MKRLTGVIAFLSTLFILVGCQSKQEEKVADTIYKNGKIYTVNEESPWVQAVAIKGGKFIRVGSNEDVQLFVGKDTKVIDLAGQFILPGLMDHHIHPSGNMDNPFDLKLPGGFDDATFEDIEAKLRQLKEEAAAETTWLVTFGHDKSTIPAKFYNRQWLDSIFGNIPIFMEDQTGHAALVNSKALELAGITKDTLDPSGSRIIKDPKTGEPTGELIEEGAMGMVRKFLPPPTIDRRVEILRDDIIELHKNGFTAFGDAKTAATVLPAWEAYFKKYGRENHITLFMHSIDSSGLDTIQHAEQLKKDFGSVDLPGVKLGAKVYVDGSIEGQTALLLEPYEGTKDFLGTLTVPKDVLTEVITDLDEAGIQVKIHAIGDGAVRESLDIFEEIIKKNGGNTNRHHIDHLNLVSVEDIPRFGELGIPAGPYPLLAQPFDYQTELVKPQLGEDRWQANTLPIRELWESGAKVSSKSDWSSSKLNPFLGMQVAVTREVPHHPELGTLAKKSAITLEQAIKSYTLNSAFILKLEDVAGSIEEGKQADMIILDTNLFDAVEKREFDAIGETTVLKTIYNGKVVYEKD